MPIKFTQAAVDNLKPAASGRETYWDSQLSGFGLRVSAPRPGSSRDGRKTWIAMGRVDGKAVMVTLGTMEQIPKVAEAREAARGAILKMRAGGKPLDERRAEKARRQAEEEEAASGRFAAAAERFMQERGQAEGWSPKYATEVRRILEHDVLPRWGMRAIREITEDDVMALLRAKAGTRERPRKGTKGGAGRQANRTLTRLSTLFRWALRKKLIGADPTLGIAPLVKEKARDRVLDDEELVRFWRGAAAAGWPYGPIFRLLLLTAQRESEVAGMQWQEIDLERRIWTLPRERTKSDRSHIIHLNELACEILGSVPRVGDLVFPSRASTVIGSFAKPKGRLDDAMAAQGDPIEPWVLHDLRRTAATLMVRLGVASDVADRILNHAAGNRQGTVKDVYNRHEFMAERKAAMDALGRFVETLRGNVVLLRRA
jgi:integrase